MPTIARRLRCSFPPLLGSRTDNRPRADAARPLAIRQRFTAVVFAGTALAGLLTSCGISDDPAASITSTAELASMTGAIGNVTIDAMPLTFEPSTCSIAGADFVVAGTGTTSSGESFSIEIEAPGTVRIAMDDSSETEGDRVYLAVDDSRLDVTGTTISGQTTLNRSGSQDHVDATVLITCIVEGS